MSCQHTWQFGMAFGKFGNSILMKRCVNCGMLQKHYLGRWHIEQEQEENPEFYEPVVWGEGRYDDQDKRVSEMATSYRNPPVVRVRITVDIS